MNSRFRLIIFVCFLTKLFHFRQGVKPEASLSELHRSQRLFQSAFHPDTGDLQNFAGRMCFNVWGGTTLCGAMMIWFVFIFFFPIPSISDLCGIRR